MLNLLRQEAFKMIKSNAFKGWTLVLIIWQIALGFAVHLKAMAPGDYINSLGRFSLMGNLIMVILASTILTSEFAQGTIKNLLDRQYSRFQVFMSKMITLIWLYVYFLFIAAILTFVMKIILFNSINLGDNFLKTLFLFIGGDALNKFLLLGAVLLISSIANKSSGTAIGIGVAFTFASQIISSLSVMFIPSHEWLKWNPFNFLLINQQVVGGAINKITYLTNPEIIFGALIYGLIFYIIADLIFERRNI